ncbi:multidrug MFS transporter [Streptomyces tsukubensis]|uniref:Terpene synthase n=2 Tax=Streptomyces tsukubensis TaxID=83656 RepID=A0A1V4ABI5_9ACTN|nr:multidrug MFS transporter [Streptomyces tsukubensis]
MEPDLAELHADGLRYTDLVAGYYLGAPDTILASIADLSVWFFVWDDRHDRDTVHGRGRSWFALTADLRTALVAPRSHLHHEEPLVAAFADCVQRLTQPLGRGWRDRFVAHFADVIDSYDEEFRNRAVGEVPTVDTYVKLRRRTFGHEVWLDLLELAAVRELPEHIRENEAYRRAGMATQDFSAWYNDLCSLPKELAGDEVHNLGISLIQHQGLSLEEAVSEVRRRVSGCVTEFLFIEKDVVALADAAAAEGTFAGVELRSAVLACLDNMRNWFSSVYWFHHESGRYRVESWSDRSHPPYVSDHLPGGGQEPAAPPAGPRGQRWRRRRASAENKKTGDA